MYTYQWIRYVTGVMTMVANGHAGRAREPRLVVLRALGLGDLLTAVPAIRALARAFPAHRRLLAAPAYLAPLVRLIGGVHDVVDTPESAVLTGVAPPSWSAVGQPDIAVDLHGRGPICHRLLLKVQPRRLIAFAHNDIPQSAGGPRWRPDEHEVRRWCRMLAGHGIAADPDDLDIRVTADPALEAVRGATIVHPGAASPGRRWPVTRFAEVARAEADAGRTVLITGGATEIELVCRLAQLAGLPKSSVLAGRTDLLRLAQLVSVAGRVVVGDTGLAHLATALRTPSVVLCGPVPPFEWGPPANRPWHRALWAGRRGDPFAVKLDPGLGAIGVDDVLHALRNLPSTAGRT